MEHVKQARGGRFPNRNVLKQELRRPERPPRNSRPHERTGLLPSKLRSLSGQLLLQRPGRPARGFDPDGAAASRAAVSAGPRAHPPGQRTLWRGIFLCHQRVPDLHTVSARRAKDREDRSLEVLRSPCPSIAAALLRGVVAASRVRFRVQTICPRKPGTLQGKTSGLPPLLQQLAGDGDARPFFLRVVARGGRTVLPGVWITDVLRQPPGKTVLP